MAEEEQDSNGVTAQETKDSKITELKIQIEEEEATLNHLFKSLKKMEEDILNQELFRHSDIPFPIWRKELDALEEKARVCDEQIKEQKDKIRILKSEQLEEYMRSFFSHFEEASRKTELTFRDIEKDAEESESKDSNGGLESLKETKDRAVSLGAELSRALVEFSLLCPGSGKNAEQENVKQKEKQNLLRAWISWRSCKEDSEVFYLIDLLMKSAEELARERVETESAKTAEQDDASRDDAIKNGLLVSFAKAVVGLQSLVSYLRRKHGDLTRNEMVGLNHQIDQCKEQLQDAKAGIKNVKELFGQETNEAKLEKMEMRTNRYWNDRFWNYVTTDSLLSSRVKHPLPVYDLSRLFVLDLPRSRFSL